MIRWTICLGFTFVVRLVITKVLMHGYVECLPTISDTAIEEDLLSYCSIANTSKSGCTTHHEPDNMPTDHSASTTHQSKSSRRDSAKIEETVVNSESTTVEVRSERQTSEDVNGADTASANMRQPEGASTKSQTPDWVPRCLYCDTANEYGYEMCDAVLPGLCQNGDDSSSGDEETESDTVLYKVLSTFA